MWVLKTFFYSSSVYSCHLFLISSASVRSITISVLYCAHLCMKCSLGISNFLEEISNFFPFCCFPLFLYIDRWRRLLYLSLLFLGTLHSNWCIFPFLLCLLLLFFCQLFARLSQTPILPFCITFSWWWFWSLPPVQCYKPQSIIPLALCLSDLIPWLYLSLLLYNRKGFI